MWAASPDADYLAGEATSPLAPHKPLLQRLGSLVTPTPDLPVERVGDRDAVGGFAVHRAPGHTPGHTAYVHEEFGVAFVGDMLRTVDGALRPSPWLATHDPSENGASVSRVAAALLPDGPEAVAVGHGDPVREGAADALARLRRERHGGSTGVES